MHYQGRLTDGTGSSVADGNYSMTFGIYDAPSGGSGVWSETQATVPAASGNFNTRMGSVTEFADSVFSGGHAMS